MKMNILTVIAIFGVWFLLSYAALVLGNVTAQLIVVAIGFGLLFHTLFPDAV